MVTVVVLDEFEDWYENLDEGDSDAVYRSVNMLGDQGVKLGFPQSSQIKGSRYAMRELRVQSAGEPIRILYVFDPLRQAVLLLGGCKTGDDRWYAVNVPIADKRYDEYLARTKLGK